MKNYIIFFLFILILFGINYKLSAQSEQLTLLVLLLIIAAFFILYLFLSGNYIRSLLFFFIFATLFEGVLKLKTTGTANIIAYLGRDILLYPVVIGAIVRIFVLKSITISQERPPLTKPIIAFVIICFIQLFNPSALNIVNGLINLRNHIEMIPLFFFGFYSMRNPKNIHILFWLMIIFAVINSLVAVYQHQIGIDEIIKWGPGYRRMFTSVSDARIWIDSKGVTHIRPPALGSDMGYATGVIQIALPLLISLIAIYLGKNKKYIPLLIAMMCVMILGAFVSGIRSLMMLSVIGAIITLLLQVKIKNTAFIVILIFLVSLGGILGLQLTSETLGEEIYDRYEGLTSPITAFSSHRGGSFLALFEYIWRFPLGRGIGLAGPAAGRFAKGEYIEPINTETYFNFILSETGLPGLILITFIAVSTIIKGYKLHSKIQNNELSWYASAQLGVLVSLFVGCFGTPLLVSYPFNSAFWFLGGMILSSDKIRIDYTLNGHINFKPNRF